MLLSSVANAQIGTPQAVIDAAKKNEEPAYIQDLMLGLSVKLYGFAQRQQIQSPLQKLAWLHTMYGVITHIQDAISWGAPNGASASCGCNGREGAQEALKNSARHAAANAAKKAASKVLNGAWGEARHAAREAIAPSTVIPGLYWNIQDAASDTASEVAKYENGSSYEEMVETSKEAGKIASRVAEWVALNSLFGYKYRDRYFRQLSDPASYFFAFKEPGNDIYAILERTYPAVLAALGDNPEKNPFESNEDTIGFMKTYFGDLTPNEMVFLAPWLGQIVSLDQVPEIHRPLFRTMWTGHSFLPWSQTLMVLAAALPLPSDVTRLVLFNLKDLSQRS